MFEGWASEYLANYLGHFCDLQQDQLRISLWRGEGRSLCAAEEVEQGEGRQAAW